MVITRIRKNNYDLKIQIVDVTDTPVDLTGCVVFFTVKRSVNQTDSQALISVSVNTFTNATNGEVSIPLTSTQTDIVGEFEYDVKVVNGSGVVTSVLKSKIIFVDQVTVRIA